MEFNSVLNMNKVVKIDANERSCNGCTHCCEGHLTCNVFGQDIGPAPCRFVDTGKGCKAYSFRPYDPCKTFKCLWKQDDRVPESFRPDKVKNIMMSRNIDGIPFLDIVEAGAPLNLDLLDWALRRFNEGKIHSMRYFYKNQSNLVSRNEEFLNAMKSLAESRMKNNE